MRRWIRAWVAAGAFALLAGTSLGAQEWKVEEHPPLRILYQRGNGAEAAVLARGAPAVLAQLEEDLGIHAEGPLVVRILPSPGPGENPDTAAPHWAVGYVAGGSREVVLRGVWVRTYPFGDLLSLFGHEMTHVLLGTLPRAETLPRWFHEGLAVMESRRWSFRDALALVQAPAGIADNISLAAGRINNPCVFHCFIDILIGVAGSEDVESAELPFCANREFSLPERSQIRVYRPAI